MIDWRTRLVLRGVGSEVGCDIRRYLFSADAIGAARQDNGRNRLRSLEHGIEQPRQDVAGARRLAEDDDALWISATRCSVLPHPGDCAANILTTGGPAMLRRQPVVHHQHDVSALREAVPDIGVESGFVPLIASDKAPARNIDKDRQSGSL